MERGFEVRTGKLAIGDPAMGLVTFDLNLLPGHYCCNRGALCEPLNDGSPTIALDGTFVFIVDEAHSEAFLKWFHRAFEDCGFVIPMLAIRLDEASAELGIEVGFYWEETLSGIPQEGTYGLDETKIKIILPAN